jgi:hypothetical protein
MFTLFLTLKTTNMKTHTATSGNVYTENTVTINGKTFTLKRDKLSKDLTNVLKNIKHDQRISTSNH